ncbi:MAG: transposase [Candidatus Amoebophilus sp.]
MKVFVEQVLKKTIIISQRITARWSVIASRWIVERTFAWFNHFRRLSKDYEIAVQSAENMVMIAHAMVLLNKLNYL